MQNKIIKTTQDAPVSVILDFWVNRFVVPDIQREEKLWGPDKRRLLIDSLINNFDIPKFYFNVKEDKVLKLEVLDGLQRLTTIKEFMLNKLKLGSAPTLPVDMHHKFFKELTEEQQWVIKDRTLNFTIYTNLTPDQQEDMFLRLNNGTTLTHAEKRNAIRGDYNDAAKLIGAHTFIRLKMNTPLNRFVGDELGAKALLLIMKDGFADVSAKNMYRVYRDYKIWDSKDECIRKCVAVLDRLNNVFKQKEEYMKRYNLFSYMLLVMDLDKLYGKDAISDSQLYKVVSDFEAARAKNIQLPGFVGKYGTDLTTYNMRALNGADSVSSLSTRHEILMTVVKEAFPKLKKLKTKKEVVA